MIQDSRKRGHQPTALIRQLADYCARSHTGFTLVELMVTTSIFIVITLVVLANYPRANGAIALRLLANDVALSVRKAQVYGVSIKSTGTIFPDYGMYFKQGTPTDYLLFADLDLNGVYNTASTCGGGSGSAAGECLEDYSIRGVNVIRKLCGIASGSGITLTPETCYKGGDNITLTELTTIFHRPNPEALMSGKRNDTDSVASLSVAGVLVGAKGETDFARMKMVQIWNTGQITIQ